MFKRYDSKGESMSRVNDVCQITVIHEKIVVKLRGQMLNEDTVIKLSNTFDVLSDPTRVKILHALSSSELCVCDISAILNMSISAVSHQLRILRNMRLVKFRRDGKMVYYSLDDEHILKLFKVAKEHVNE
jgi:DNA-binding transcriptional ArsR family regulator